MASPGERSFNDPTLRYDLEAYGVVGTFDGVDDPGAGVRRGRCSLRTLVAAVGKDAFDERKQAARTLVQHPRNAVTILDVGGVDGDIQQQAERVDQDVALATRDL